MTNNHFNFLLMCSGGSDSMFLLNQLFNYFNNTSTSENTENSYTALLEDLNLIDLLPVKTDNSTNCEVINLHVVYVNHNISTYSKAWGDVVRNYCDQLKLKIINHQYKFDILFKELSVEWNNNEIKSETNCRTKRYDLIKYYIADSKNNFVAVFTAHHKNDNYENQLISIFKNRTFSTEIKTVSQLKIVVKHLQNSNSSTTSIPLLRPILHLTKQDILDYCYQHDIPFVTDESNFVEDNIRNVLRNSLFPKIDELSNQQQYYDGMKNFFCEYNNMINCLTEFARQELQRVSPKIKITYKRLAGGVMAINECNGKPIVLKTVYSWDIDKLTNQIQNSLFLALFLKQIVDKLDVRAIADIISKLPKTKEHSYVESSSKKIFLIRKIKEKHGKTAFVFIQFKENKLFLTTSF